MIVHGQKSTRWVSRPVTLLILGAVLASQNCLAVAQLADVQRKSKGKPWAFIVDAIAGTETPAPVNVSSPPSLALPAGLPAGSFTVQASSMSVPSQIGQFVPAGIVYNVGPDPEAARMMTDAEYLALTMPAGTTATLKYTYDKAALADAGLTEEFVVFFYDQQTQSWMRTKKVTVDTSTGTVTAETDHFTPFILTAMPSSNGSTVNAPACLQSDYPSGLGGTPGPTFSVIDVNFKYYVDRAFYIVPNQDFTDLGFSQALAISTCNGASSCGTQPNHKLYNGTDYIHFTAHMPMDVYLMYDTRGGTNKYDNSKDAAWLFDGPNPFAAMGRFIETTDTVGEYKVYKKTVAAGEVVQLDGNRNRASSGSIQTNYWVVLKRAGSTTPEPASNLCMAAPDTVDPQPVTNLTAYPGATEVILTWTNPPDTDFAGVVIRRSTSAPPALMTEGFPPTGSGIGDHGYWDTGLVLGTTYYYTVFALDSNNNYRAVSTSTVTQVDTDGDGLSDAAEVSGPFLSGQPTNETLRDTDGDGTDDGNEAAQLTDPNNPDTLPPAITAFTLLSPSPTNAVLSAVKLSAIDNVGVTHWMITSTNTAPTTWDPRWTSQKPQSVAITASGTHTRYAWTKDAAGNISRPFAPITINLQGVHVPTSVHVADPSTNGVYSYAINGTTGQLTSAGSVVSGGSAPSRAVIHPSGKFLYVLNSGAASIVTYSISVSGALTLVDTTAVPGAENMIVHPSGRFLYAGGSGSNNLSAYSVNVVSGVLTSIGTIGAALPPVHMIFSPSGSYLFIDYGGGRAYVIIDEITGLAVASAKWFTFGSSLRYGSMDAAGGYTVTADESAQSIYLVRDGLGAISSVSRVGYGYTSTRIDASGRFVYAIRHDVANSSAARGLDVFKLDTWIGQLSFLRGIENGAFLDAHAMDDSGQMYFYAAGGSLYGNLVTGTDGNLFSLRSAVGAFTNPVSVAVASTHVGNDPPVAKISHHYRVEYTDVYGQRQRAWEGYSSFTLGVMMFFHTRNSSDPDAAACGANPANYVKTASFDSVPPGSTLTNASITLDPQYGYGYFTPDRKGTYVVRFTFTDDGGSCGPPLTSSAVQVFVLANARVQGAYYGSAADLSSPAAGAVFLPDNKGRVYGQLTVNHWHRPWYLCMSNCSGPPAPRIIASCRTVDVYPGTLHVTWNMAITGCYPRLPPEYNFLDIVSSYNVVSWDPGFPKYTGQWFWYE